VINIIAVYMAYTVREDCFSVQHMLIFWRTLQGILATCFRCFIANFLHSLSLWQDFVNQSIFFLWS